LALTAVKIWGQIGGDLPCIEHHPGSTIKMSATKMTGPRGLGMPRTSTVQQLKKEAVDLASPVRRKREWLKLSQVLASLHEHRDQKGKAEFRGLIEDGILGQRTAYYLLQVGQLIRGSKLSRADAERIGWTKLQIIGPWINVRDRGARHNSVHEVKRRIAKKGRKKPHCVLLYFTTTQYDRFRAAMRRHGAEKARGGRRGRGLVGKEEVILKVLEQTPPAITR
jgi:hypothetical protein